MADSRVSFVPRGVWRGVFHIAETQQVGLVLVYVFGVNDVYDGVSLAPHKDMFEKFGHVLNISESKPFPRAPA